MREMTIVQDVPRRQEAKCNETVKEGSAGMHLIDHDWTRGNFSHKSLNTIPKLRFMFIYIFLIGLS